MSLTRKVEEQEKIIKFLASKYARDTGRSIQLPLSLGQIFEQPALLGDDPPAKEIDAEFEKELKKGVINAEKLKKPMTFFEAVEYLRLPLPQANADKKGAKKKQGPGLNVGI